MNITIDFTNRLMTAIFGVLLWPFEGLAPIWGLTAVSLLTGLLMLWVFARVSNQDGIRQSKDRVRGNLLGVRLYQHDVGVVLRLQAKVFRETIRYLNYSLAPVFVLMLPLLLILIQLNLFFSLKPIPVGREAILTVRTNDEGSLLQPVQVADSTAFAVETPPVRVPHLKEVSWRLRAAEAGRHLIRISLGNETLTKEFVVGDGWDAVSPLRTADTLDLLLYSGEPPVPSGGPIRAVYLSYPHQSVNVLGWQANWLVYFFVVSILGAFLLKSFFGVEL